MRPPALPPPSQHPPGGPTEATTWQRNSALLDEVLALDERDRPRWLAALQARDADAAADVSVLLASHAQAEASGFLAHPPERPAVAFKATAAAGMSCGAYRLVEAIGSGGMGVVWRGERADGHFQRTVAIKLLHADAVSPALRSRLRHEAALLARLAHPHIAGLIDAGVADNGQPYLVLEHVAGQRIDAACDALALPLARRLALMLDVLGAVAHAHRHLVVHRDLKPANVLLTDGDHAVKLLDFGIATLLAGNPDEVDGTPPTGDPHAPRGWTPRYAAPEQVSGGAVTTATDIYALGLLLQDLVGRCPAREAVRRDLDAIVACATATEPAARYANASAMAEDIQRHLHHRPVRARQAGWAYAAGRFLRRHVRIVSVAALAGLSLVAGTAVALWQRHDAQTQRDAALVNKRDAEAVRDFAGRLLVLGGPHGRTLNAEQRVDYAESLARRLYAGQPAVLANLLMMVASENTVLQRRPARERNYADAAALAASSGDPGLAARAACAVVPLDAPDSGPRVAAMAQALPAHDPRFAVARHHCHGYAATLLAWQGQASAAQQHAAASEAALAELGPMRVLLAADMHETRGDVARATGDVVQAEAHYAASLRADAWAAGAPAMHLQTASRLNYQMLMHLQIGLPQRALALSDDLLTLYASMNTTGDVPAYVLSNRGTALMQLGRLSEAEVVLRQAVVRGEQTGSTRYRVAAQARLAELLLLLARTQEARELLDQTQRDSASWHDTGSKAAAALARARWQLAADEPALAAAAAGQAVALAEQNSFLRPLQQSAELLHAQALRAAGRDSDAAQAATRALQLSRALAGPHASPGTLHTGRAGLARAQALRRADPAGAQREAALALAALEHALGPAHADSAAARAMAQPGGAPGR